MSDTLRKIPSFNEVMNKTSSNGKIPSFDDIMGEEIKKKDGGIGGVSASAMVGEILPTGAEETPPLQSPSPLPLDIKGIFEFGKVRDKNFPLPANLPRVEKEIKTVLQKVHYGDIKPEELSELYYSDYGKEVVRAVVAKNAPEVLSAIGSGESFKAAAKKINTTNRINYVNEEREGVSKLDNNINTSISNLRNPTTEEAGTVTSYINELRSELTPDDYNNNDKISNLISKVKKIQQVEQRNYLSSEARQKSNAATTNLLNELNERLNHNISKTGVTPTLNQLGDQLNQVVLAKVMEAKAQGNDDVGDDNERVNHFKLGMTAIEKTDPILFNNTLNSIAQLKKVGSSEFTTISNIGQKIANTMRFRGGAFDESLIGTETAFDYTTFDQKIAEASVKIGEWAKKKGYGNTAEYSEKIIRQGAKENDVSDPEIINTLVFNEKLKFYDQIPKGKWMDDIASGIMQPLVGINSTLNSWNESPVETYFRSTQTTPTVGAQQVANEKGELSDILPSERGRFTTDMFRGLGQFIPQVLLTKGVGAGLRGATAAVGIPLSAGKARNVADFGGTAISTFLQSYGPSYEEELRKTGDADTAALIGTIDGISSAGFELLLPDVRIAEKAFRGLRQGLHTDLVGLIKKGGDPGELASKARPYIQKFFTNATSTLVQENLEELGTTYVDFVTESIFDPASAKERNLNKELWDTFKATSAAMVLPAILGAGGSSFQKDFTVKSLHSGAINFAKEKESLEKSLDKGYINQNEYNSAITLLTTHKQSIAAAPIQDINGNAVAPQKQLDYAFEETKIKVNKEKADQSQGVAKKMYEQRIKESEDIQTSILMPSTKDGDINKPKTEDNASLQEDQKRDEKTSDTQEVQSEGGGLNEGQGTVRQETLAGQGAAASTAAAPLVSNKAITNQDEPAPSKDSTQNELADIEKRRQDEIDDWNAHVDGKEFKKGKSSDQFIQDIKIGRDKINEKYDAELSKLQTQKDSTQNELESKKADIEKRRQEELDKQDSRYKNDLAKDAKERTTEKAKGYSVETGYYSKSKEGIKNNHEGVVSIINEKYDAELAKLPTQKDSTQNEVEDIERRRKNELNNVKEVTWEGLMKVGNTITHNGEQKKILEQRSPFIFITDKGIVSEKPEDIADSYILYQNGKKDLSKQKEEINSKYDAELAKLQTQKDTTQEGVADVVPSDLKNEQRIMELEVERVEQMKKALKPKVDDLIVDDITWDKIVKHDDRMKLKNEMLRIKKESDILKDLSDCVYGK